MRERLKTIAERWPIDFIHDRLNLGRPIPVVVDDFTRINRILAEFFVFGGSSAGEPANARVQGLHVLTLDALF